MRLAGFLLIGSLAACQAQGGPDVYEETQPSLWCGTIEPSMTAKLSIESEMRAHPSSMTSATINVYVHVIRKGVGADNGDVSDDQIHDQLGVLNAAYKSTGFSFELASIDRTTNTAWFAMADGTPAEHDAKALLRKGTSRDLNLYTAAPGAGSLGWATFPSAAKSDPIGDGVVMLYTALPGGASAPYDQGDQTVHEVGHWLGLFHTFSAACDTNGDFVSDTPASDAPAYGCPVGRDTCGGGGEDQVRNFMDSTDDGCMNTFTPGQAARMRAQFATFRLGR
jgi:hypothetical protein